MSSTNDKSNSVNTFRDCFIGACFVLATFILFGKHLEYWWWNDDATILMHAISHPGASYFYNPNHWRDLVVSSFTPWVSAMFAVDHLISPWNPRVHYFHHLTVIGLSGAALWLWLRQRTHELVAIATGIAFLWGAPVAVVAQQLMTRHYAEGFLYFLIHLLFVDKAYRTESRDSVFFSIIAALAAMIAMLSKEVYVPLLLISLIWIDKRRLWIITPSLLGIPLFLILRTYMLGTVIGGYQDNTVLFRAIPESFSKFINIPENLFQPVGLAFATWAAVCLYAVYRKIVTTKSNGVNILVRSILTGIFVLAIILSPLWPLSAVTTFTINDQRFYFALWGVSLLALGLMLKELPKWAGLSVVLIMFSLAHSPRNEAKKNLEPVSSEFFAQGKAILNEHSGTKIWMTPLVANWYSSSIRDMRSMITSDPIELVSDWVQTLKPGSSDGRYLRYNNESREMTEVSPTAINTERLEWASAVERSLEYNFQINMTYTHTDRSLSWNFSIIPRIKSVSDSEVKFTAVLFEGGVFPMPPNGIFKTNDITSGCLVLRFDTKDSKGQAVTGYSPVLKFKPDNRGTHSNISSIEYLGPVVKFSEIPSCSNRRSQERSH
jgi:hypothetical protein